MSSADGSLLAIAPDIGTSVKKSCGKGDEGGFSSCSTAKSLPDLDGKGAEPPTSHTASDLNLSEVETGFESYLEKLESIHWENSSSSVANVLGQMLSTVNDLSISLDAQFDPSSTEHMNLQHEIQSELHQIGELFSDYAGRHPSICHDQTAAAAVFEQLQAAGSMRKPSSKK